MDSLTGVGSDFNLESTPDRLNSQERAEERFKGIDVDEKRRDAQSLIPPNFWEGD